MSGFVTESKLNQILERIAAIQKSIDLDGLGRIRQAYTYPPADPSTAALPFTVNLGIPSDVSHVTPGLYWPVNDIDMHFCFANWQGDSTLRANLAQVARWHDLIFSTFGAHVRLSPPETPGVPDFDFVVDAYLINWSNLPTRITWGTAEWAGLIFRLRVRQYLFTTITA